MRTVLLSTDGALLPEGKEAASDPLPCLGMRVELERGCTLRSFFRMLERYPLLKRISEFLETWTEEAARAPERGCVTDLFERLELGKTVEMIGYPGRPRLEIFTSVRGVGGTGGEEPRDVRFLALENLLDAPFVLGGLNHVVFGDKARMLTFETTYSLYEVIEGVAWELGFHTAPKQCSLRG